MIHVLASGICNYESMDKSVNIDINENVCIVYTKVYYKFDCIVSFG